MKIKYIKESKRKTVPKEFRQLPADVYTMDAADPERIHKNDPAHVIKGLLKERAKKLVARMRPVERAKLAVDTLFEAWRQDPFKVKDLGQDWVDIWRAKVILNWAQKELIEDALHHLWFDDPHRADIAGLLPGPPPPRGERPKHLQNLNLEVQVLDWSARLRDIVSDIGVKPSEALEEIRGKIQAQNARLAAQKAAREAQKAQLS